MSATTVPKKSAAQRVTLRGVLAAETGKIVGLRSTAALSIVGVVAAVLVTAAEAFTAGGPVETTDVLTFVTSGYYAALLFVAMVATKVSTVEYEHHSMVTTLAVVPSRTPVVVAKALVGLALGVVVGAPALVLSLLVADAVAGGHAASDASTWPVVGYLTVYSGVVGVLAAMCGLLVRSTIGALATLAGFLIVLPGLLAVPPVAPLKWIASTLPGAASSNFYVTDPSPDALSQPAGLVACAVWTVLVVVAAIAVVRRRDA